MSPSINQLTEEKVPFISFRAVWQPLPGRNPCACVTKEGSKIASKISSIAPWTILSLGEAIPRGRVPFPFDLGISILLAGLNWKEFVLISFFSFSNHGLAIPSKVSESIPGVIFPGEDFSLE